MNFQRIATGFVMVMIIFDGVEVLIQTAMQKYMTAFVCLLYGIMNCMSLWFFPFYRQEAESIMGDFRRYFGRGNP